MTNQTEKGASPVVRLIDGKLWLMESLPDGTWQQFGFTGPVPLPSGWAGALRIAGCTIANPTSEGCTAADARVLRDANHALALENHALRQATVPAGWAVARTVNGVSLTGPDGTKWGFGQAIPAGGADYYVREFLLAIAAATAKDKP